MTNLKEFIETHELGIVSVFTGAMYVAALAASAWFVRDYCRISKYVKEIHRIQCDVHQPYWRR